MYEEGKLPLIEGKEIKIPVPWGVIAAKEYGNPNGTPVLAIHGWLDNCGSFDPLMPYIIKENNLHVVSMDEPGCGLSSHKPLGSDYERWGTLRDMKRVIQFMGWNKVTLLGHSQGGHYSLLFASIYPEMVERVISIDMIKPITMRYKVYSRTIRETIENRLKYDDKFVDDSTAPVYSEEEAVKKWIQSTGQSVNERSVKILMKRGSKPLNGGVAFTRDIRLKLRGIDPYPSNEVVYQIVANLRCDLLIIDAKQKPRMDAKKIEESYLALYKTNCRLFRFESVDGAHHVHMNDPELVAPLINEFIRESLAAGPLKGVNAMQSKL